MDLFHCRAGCGLGDIVCGELKPVTCPQHWLSAYKQYLSLNVMQIWISPDTGIATPLVHQVEAVFQNSHATVALILLGFAAIHSGMAYLRPSGGVLAESAWDRVEPCIHACDAAQLAGEAAVGPRAYRVLFAAISLPLAVLAVVYFINHRYDGMALWNLRRAPYVHELVFVLNFVSFYFLYPSTFNLLEVRSHYLRLAM